MVQAGGFADFAELLVNWLESLQSNGPTIALSNPQRASETAEGGTEHGKTGTETLHFPSSTEWRKAT
jgi:phosphohistidine phosphatase SixA